MSRDPIGYAAGDANLYAYVSSSPVNRLDALGLESGFPTLISVPNSMFGMGPGHAIGRELEHTFIEEPRIVWHNTRHMKLVERLYVTGGMTAANFTGVRYASDATNRFDAVDGHEQSTYEQIVDGVQGVFQLAAFGYGGSQVCRIRPTGAPRGISSQLNISRKQFGPKMAQRARELGLDPSSAKVRYQFRSRIERIFRNADEVRSGPFRGQGPNGTIGGDNRFFRRGKDVVVTDANGNFITLLTNGINNGFFKGGVPLP